LAASGVPGADIARVVAIDAKTLRKHDREELDTGHVKATAKVVEFPFCKAPTDRPQCVTAAIFWMKTRCGWRETPQSHEIAVTDVSQMTHEELIARLNVPAVVGKAHRPSDREPLCSRSAILSAEQVEEQMTSDDTPLGFVGLGLMGLPMARRLLAQGCALTVWNRSAEKTEAARRDGASVAASARGVAEASQIVFTCVTDTAAMEAVMFGPDGIAEADGHGKLLIDHSSIHPGATRAFAARLAEANGMSWLDAPVSGGVAGAETGTLVILVGGATGNFARARPFLAHLSQRTSHMGEIGAGQTAKLCNQMIVGCSFAVIAEALRLAANSGIDPHALIEAMTGGFADSRPLQIFGPRMLRRIDEPLAYVGVVLKDVDTALDVGHRTGTPMPMTAAVSEIYRVLVAQGFGRAEFDALYRHLGGEA